MPTSDTPGANILLDFNRKVIRLADFGAAVRLPQNRQLYEMAGTPPFMAPEVVIGKPGYSYKCDVWSTGCVIIEMGTGRPPWVPEDGHYNRFAVLFKVS